MSLNPDRRMLGLAALVVLVGLAGPAAAATHNPGEPPDTAAYDITVATHPEPAAIVPDRDVVELRVRVTRGGEPARNVDLSYRLDAPPRTFWFSTDFPVVEGTPLLNGTVHLPAGHHETSMILPIRGTYRLRTRAEGPRGTAVRTVTFGVSENPREKLYLAVFLGILLLIGGAAGFLASRASGAGTPTGLLAVLVALGFAVTLTPSAVRAHGEGDWDPEALEKKQGVRGRTDAWAVELDLFPQPVRVGELLEVRLRVRPRTHGTAGPHGAHAHGGEDASRSRPGGPGELYRAEARFVHAEGGQEMITQAIYLEDGTGRFEVQLFDGAPHYLVIDLYRSRSDPDRDPHHDHDHGASQASHEDGSSGEKRDGTSAVPWEERGRYVLGTGEHALRFHDSGDPSMKWVLLPASQPGSDERARGLFETDCPAVDPGATISSGTDCVRLALNPDGTAYTLNVEEPGPYRLYTEHVPAEFDMTLLRPDGEAVGAQRRIRPGKGEHLVRVIRRVDVRAVPPPLDDIVKSMLTLMGTVLAGFLAGYYLPRWTG